MSRPSKNPTVAPPRRCWALSPSAVGAAGYYIPTTVLPDAPDALEARVSDSVRAVRATLPRVHSTKIYERHGPSLAVDGQSAIVSDRLAIAIAEHNSQMNRMWARFASVSTALCAVWFSLGPILASVDAVPHPLVVMLVALVPGTLVAWDVGVRDDD